MRSLRIAVVCVSAVLVVGWSADARAHCDTLDGPVVKDAKAALERGDPAAVLKWVDHAHEQEIVAAFKRSLAARAKGPEAREVADLYFFETLVRIHRAGEGAPFTGLKPAGTEIEPGILAADQALAAGKVDEVVEHMSRLVQEGIRQRFAKASELRSHADHNTEAGRQFVHAYVEFMHYLERLHRDATTDAAHSAHGEPSSAEHAAPAHAH